MNPIHNMHHSPKMDEPEGQKLDRDNNLPALYAELSTLAGEWYAKSFGMTCQDIHLDYEGKCRFYVLEIARLTKQAERPEPLVTGKPDCPAECPVKDFDQIRAEADRQDEIGYARNGF